MRNSLKKRSRHIIWHANPRKEVIADHGNKAVRIGGNKNGRSVLEAWKRCPKTARRLYDCAHIVLRVADGASKSSIAKEQIKYTHVGITTSHFARGMLRLALLFSDLTPVSLPEDNDKTR